MVPWHRSVVVLKGAKALLVFIFLKVMEFKCPIL